MKGRRERRGKKQKWAMVVVGCWLFKSSLIQESLMKKVTFEQIFAGHLVDVDECLGTPVWKGAIVNAHSSNMLIFLNVCSEASVTEIK